MRAVVQRVRSASVHVADEAIATIGPGLAVLLAVAADDRPEDGERVAAKLLALRIFDDGRGRLDRTVKDVGGSVLVIPQFTLYGDTSRGRRPSWSGAARRSRLHAPRGRGIAHWRVDEIPLGEILRSTEPAPREHEPCS